jgi:hypothetical protein
MATVSEQRSICDLRRAGWTRKNGWQESGLPPCQVLTASRSHQVPTAVITAAAIASIAITRRLRCRAAAIDF